MIPVLIVDDEPLARETIRGLLLRDPEVSIAGECSGVDAEELIAKVRPRIMFLDVQMPEVDGFELLDRVGPEAVPVVVFVTAYDQYALRAFEVHALDYLLKPFDDTRFAAALNRAKERARGGSEESGQRLLELLDERHRSQGFARRFLVRGREKLLVVRAADVDWVGAADDYISLHAGGKAHLLRETMNEIEQRLDPAQFFRCHRSAIVNIDRVREIHPLFRGDCELLLADGSRVRLSRTRREEFERLFDAPGRRT